MTKLEDFNVTGELRKVLEYASMIKTEFSDTKTRTCYVLLGAMCIPDSSINRCLYSYHMQLDPEILLNQLLNNQELFTEVFGKKAASKYFYDTDTVVQTNEQDGKIGIFNQKDKSVVLFNDEYQKIIENAIQNIMEFYEDFENGELVQIDYKYSDKLNKTYEEAIKRCVGAKKNYLNLDNLIFSILNAKDTSAYKLLEIALDSMQIPIEEFMEIMSNECEVDEIPTEGSIIIPKKLQSCCHVLNENYQEGETSDILGREEEIETVWTIASKKTKRNAVLVGKPGVGKSAIIEAMTQQIVNGKCPKRFLEYRVISLNINSVVAGTKYRGEFEEKIDSLIKLLQHYDNIILFVDEMHQMMGAGSTEESGRLDLSGALKPILARGDVVFIGATTLDEYEKFVQRDGAFKRRFEPVLIKEPKHAEIKPMIHQKIQRLKKYHEMEISDEIIDYAILSSYCFNSETANPDRTLDLCDMSMAIASYHGKKYVEKEDIIHVYRENYNQYHKMPKDELKSTAYHEAGHFVAHQLLKFTTDSEIIAVSIVPGYRSLGMNILENTGIITTQTCEYLEAEIQELLAGRIAENLINSNLNSGAMNDLERVTKIARGMVSTFGLDTEYSNYILCTEDVKGKSNLSEKQINYITKKAKLIVDSAYEKAEKLITDHFDKVEIVANLLLEKGIVSGKQLIEAIK